MQIAVHNTAEWAVITITDDRTLPIRLEDLAHTNDETPQREADGCVLQANHTQVNSLTMVLTMTTQKLTILQGSQKETRVWYT